MKKVLITLLVLFASSGLLYLNLAVAQAYGKTYFYSAVEHLAMAFYVVSSLVSTSWILQFVKRYRDNLHGLDYVWIWVLSGVLTSLVNISLWSGLRLTVSLATGRDIPQMAWDSIFANLLFFLFNVHTVCSGVYLVWKGLKDNHKVQMEKAHIEATASRALLKNLQRQISPHFLFNNLNVLSSLISYAPEQAETYIEKFASIYRYMIRISEEDLVCCNEEMEFAVNYFDLIKIRFSDSYQLQIINDDVDLAQWQMPPGVLQTLIENAIKHNSATRDNPLHVSVFVKPRTITIFNQVRRKLNAMPSTHTGLRNLKARYQVFCHEQVVVEQSDHYFSITVPILER